ncbi:hypothetical protein EHS25_001452 [Saitozyma podzolica]|uniref:BRCT domain-containing protein n=1 Tax=Saitozyma podzolica TaxID=1890683 RepID=A0A427YG24_9TREE|nr:hypothetical protein EHS25_001452 [Saitozyma podzolica]
MADTFEDETQQPSFHVTAPSTHSSSQVPPSSQSSHPMPKSTPVPESLNTLPLFVANQIQLGGGPQANGGARSPSDPQLEQAADVATELQSETRDVVGSLPRKQSPTWATAPLDPQQQQDHVESPPRHTSASPVPTEEDELDPESFSIERQHVEEEPPNIPSPANTDTPPHSPTRRPASPPAASQSLLKPRAATVTPQKRHVPVSLLSPTAIHSSRQGLARGLRSLGDLSPSNAGFKIVPRKAQINPLHSVEESQDSFAQPPKLTPFNRFAVSMEGRAPTLRSIPQEQSAQGNDGQAGPEQRISEAAPEPAAEAATEEQGGSLSPLGLRPRSVVSTTEAPHMPEPFVAIAKDRQSMDGGDSIAGPSRRRFADLAHADSQSSPSHSSHLFSSQPGGLVYTQDDSTSQQSFVFQATQFRAPRSSPLESSADKTPMEAEATQLNDRSQSWPVELPDHQEKASHLSHPPFSDSRSSEESFPFAQSLNDSRQAIAKDLEAAQAAADQRQASDIPPETNVPVVNANPIPLPLSRDPAENEATQITSDDTQRRSDDVLRARQILTKTSSTSSHGSGPPVSANRQLSRRKPPALGMTSRALSAYPSPASPLMSQRGPIKSSTSGERTPDAPAQEDEQDQPVERSPASPRFVALNHATASEDPSANPRLPTSPSSPPPGVADAEPTFVDALTLPPAPPPARSPIKTYGGKRNAMRIANGRGVANARTSSISPAPTDRGSERGDNDVDMSPVSSTAADSLRHDPMEVDEANGDHGGATGEPIRGNTASGPSPRPRKSKRERRKSAKLREMDSPEPGPSSKRPRTTKAAEGSRNVTTTKRLREAPTTPPSKQSDGDGDLSEPETPPDPSNFDFESFRPTAAKAWKGRTPVLAPTKARTKREKAAPAAPVGSGPATIARKSRLSTETTDLSAAPTTSSKTPPGPGVLVLARWAQNKAYYFGRISARVGDQFDVSFLDRTAAMVALDELRMCDLRRGDVLYYYKKQFRGDWRVVDEGVPLEDEIKVSNGGKEARLKIRDLRIAETNVKRDFDDRRFAADDPRLPPATDHGEAQEETVESSEQGKSPAETLSRVLEGKVFLVTATERTPHHDTDERIRAHGGVVNSSWQAIVDLPHGAFGSKLKRGPTPFVVFDGSPVKMMPKVMVALAAGIPIVSSQFVEDVSEGRTVDWQSYLISPGRSEHLKQDCSQLVDPGWGAEGWDATTARNPRQPFEGMSFLFLRPRERRYEELKASPICSSVDTIDRYTDLDDFDYILFEHRESKPAIPASVRDDPRTVSTAWLKECLLMGAALPAKLTYD